MKANTLSPELLNKMDDIDRLPQTGAKGTYLKQQLKDKLVEHKQYIDKNGQDLPDIRDWTWGVTHAAKKT